MSMNIKAVQVMFDKDLHVFNPVTGALCEITAASVAKMYKPTLESYTSDCVRETILQSKDVNDPRIPDVIAKCAEDYNEVCKFEILDESVLFANASVGIQDEEFKKKNIIKEVIGIEFDFGEDTRIRR